MSSIHRTLSEPGMGTSVPAILRAAGVVVAMEASPVAAAAAAADDIDRRAAEFIERFRRNESLELRYCAVYSPLTPAKPPISPDTYFKLSGAHHHGAVAAGGSPAPYVRKMSSLRPRRPSGMSIKWPTAGRPTVRV